MKNIVFPILLVLACLPVLAQKDTTKNLQLNQVEVIKAFEANLEEAKKVNVEPSAPEVSPYNPQFKYNITIVPADLKYPDPQIKPLAMEPDGPFKVNKGYLYAGYGSRNNPSVTAGFHTARKDTYEAGIEANYMSLDNSKNVPYQKMRNAGLALYGNYMIRENLKVYGKLKTDFNKRYLYHTELNADSLYSESQSGRNLTGYNIMAGISNVEPTRYSLNYNLEAGVRKLAMTNEDANEGGIFASAMAEKLFGQKTVLSVAGKFDYTSFSGNKELSLTLLQLKPVLKTKIAEITLQGGVHLLSAGSKKGYVFPELMASYGLAGQKLQVFAGLGQDYFINNLTNVSHYNPFVSTRLDSLVNTVFRNYYGGVRGRFSVITYEARVGWKDVSSQLFMVNRASDARVFDMLYDDAGIFYVSGSIDFSISEKMNIGGLLTQNFFSLSTLPQPWHMQNFQASAYARYMMLDDRLQLRSDLYLASGIPYLENSGIASKTGSQLDLNLTAEYSIIEKLRVFVSGENLLNNKYQRWSGYPVAGTNFCAGVKLLF